MESTKMKSLYKFCNVSIDFALLFPIDIFPNFAAGQS